MQRAGIRRLLVISGDITWSWQQALALSNQLDGDWIWVGEAAPKGVKFIFPHALKKLLGQERLHGIFDASTGLDIETLAVLAGMLRAGSWLLLLVPEWHAWPRLPDNNSLRWIDLSAPIVTPNFIRYFQQQLIDGPSVVLWRQGDPCVIGDNLPRPCWQPVNGKPVLQQQSILTELIAAKSGVWVVTAARGRGKSALAGMLIAQWPGLCWITGPTKAATQILSKWAGDKVVFWAPDVLLQYCREQDVTKVDWLLVDEAAAIPVPLLAALRDYFPRILLTTTVQGYEGTGRGFLLKFCSSLPNLHEFKLTEPIRWASDDPLERLLDRVLLLVDKVDEPILSQQVNIVCCEQTDWLANLQRLQCFYGLLNSAHYRTSSSDLRRLMDAPGMYFSAAMVGESIVGALWGVEEGGLDTDLAHEIWAGRRRPRGNLVAQSLAAHAGLWRAPTLLSRRISRVAVIGSLRRRGIARQMIFTQQQQAAQQGLDFLSVSFGYTKELWHFWQACGFELVRIGAHREASSGCYTAMAILPLSDQAQALCQAAQRQLARDWPWLKQRVNLCLSLHEDQDLTLTEDDWRELAGFAFAFRSSETSFAALTRLVIHSRLSLPTLRQYVQHQKTRKSFVLHESITAFGLAGRKALVHRWRQEAGQAMAALDENLCAQWQQWAAPRL